MRIRGRSFLLGALVVCVGAMVGLTLAFRYTTRNRFAMGVYAIDETPELKPVVRFGFVSLSSNQTVPVNKPLLARIERRTASATALLAVAYVIADDGRVVYTSQPLVAKTVVQRSWLGYNQTVPIQEASLPAVETWPASKEYYVLIARLPNAAAHERLLAETAQDHPGEKRIAQMRSLSEYTLGGKADHHLLSLRKSAAPQ